MCYGNERTFALLVAGLTVLLGTGACSLGGPSKPLHYYSLDSGDRSGTSSSVSSSSEGAGLRVEPFRAPEIYRDPSIIWRNRRHMQRFRFNRWATAPPQLLQTFFADLLRRHAGDRIGWISTSDEKNLDARFFVQGTLRDFYLTKKEDESSWQAVIRARIKLLMRPLPESGEQEDPVAARISPQERTVLGTWTLSASGITAAPSGESDTPDAMNDLLENLSDNLRTNADKIITSIRSKIQSVKNR